MCAHHTPFCFFCLQLYVRFAFTIYVQNTKGERGASAVATLSACIGRVMYTYPQGHPCFNFTPEDRGMQTILKAALT